jgi:transposase
MKKRHSVTNEEWNRIEPLLPKRGKMGRPRKAARELVDAMLWVFKTGAPWRDLPETYGPWKTVYNNFLRWRDEGVWENILQNLNPEPEAPWQVMIDSTSLKAHQHSAGAKKGVVKIRLLVDPGED